jgi:hypothetical protein
MCTPTLLGLVVENPEQPRAHLGPTLEALDRLQKRHEHVLRQILRIARREPHAPSGAIEPPPVLVDHVAERDRIPRA